jgi:hypothetical protein
MTANSASGIDLVGRAMDATFNAGSNALNDSANKARADEAKRLSAPLQGHGIREWYTGELQSQAASALTSSPWLRGTAVLDDRAAINATVERAMIRIGREGAIAEVGGKIPRPAVLLSVDYHLSHDAAFLIMRADLVYYRPGQDNAAHSRTYTYYSEAVGTEKGDAAVAKWVATNQQMLRQRMSEGVGEIVAMIKGDFLSPTTRDSAKQIVDLSYFDAESLSHARRQGYLLRKGGERIQFQENDFGDMFSMVPEKIGS